MHVCQIRSYVEFGYAWVVYFSSEFPSFTWNSFRVGGTDQDVSENKFIQLI